VYLTVEKPIMDARRVFTRKGKDMVVETSMISLNQVVAATEEN
jgi:hypothetical protein